MIACDCFYCIVLKIEQGEKIVLDLFSLKQLKYQNSYNLRGRDGGADVCSKIRNSTSNA